MVKRRDADQLALDGTERRRKVGRVERSVSSAIVAGRGDDLAERRFAAAETLAREVGAALDVAARKGQVYAVAQLSPRLLDVLRELRLTPNAVAADVDPLTELLHELSGPPVLDSQG